MLGEIAKVCQCVDNNPFMKMVRSGHAAGMLISVTNRVEFVLFFLD